MATYSPEIKAVAPVDAGKNVDDEQSKSVGALHTKVDDENPESNSPKSEEHDLYKED